jgi:hypothetical protein
MSYNCVEYYYTKKKGFNTLIYLNTVVPTQLGHFPPGKR